MKKLFLIFAILLMAVPAMAGQVKFGWDMNDPAPEGYRVYLRYGDGVYDYQNPIWEGSGTETDVLTIDDNRVFYAVVRAYVGPYESADSNEVTWAIISKVTGFHGIYEFPEPGDQP